MANASCTVLDVTDMVPITTHDSLQNACHNSVFPPKSSAYSWNNVKTGYEENVAKQLIPKKHRHLSEGPIDSREQIVGEQVTVTVTRWARNKK